MDTAFEFLGSLMSWWTLVAVIAFTLLVYLPLKSFYQIGPTEVGLVEKQLGFKKLENGNILARNGEVGYQEVLLMPGLRFKLWPFYVVTKHPVVQIPAGQIGVVIAQVGGPAPMGAKSAVYKPEFGNFQDVGNFMANGGQKGVQRPVLPPGTVAPIHPIGFLVITKQRVYGVPVSNELGFRMVSDGEGGTRQVRGLGYSSFGLKDKDLEVTIIQPIEQGDGSLRDTIGIVTTLEGDPIPNGAIANRLGDFTDIADLEKKEGTKDSDLVEAILSPKNEKHNNFQDFQLFLDNGGKIGLQHDPLLYGAYNLNPFLVRVEHVPMLVVDQGEVAVVKAYVGLATEDTSGEDFKHGAIVRPGHRGIWQTALLTGKFAINPRCYDVEIVPTSILTLNWADATSKAHDLDKDLKQILAKSKEGFEFKIDLQVQIHVPHTKAPRVISIVGTMKNLVNEVLQAAVGNHFRDRLQSMAALEFIQKRQGVQENAEEHIKKKLGQYEVETRGVYIQDVVLPKQLVEVLQSEEIAKRQVDMYTAEQQAQEQRVKTEASKGTADQQANLARSAVGIQIAENNAKAVQATADGDAYRLEKVGRAKAVETEAEGLAVAKGLQAQKEAVGADQTTIVNAVKELAGGTQHFMPETLVLNLGAGANLGDAAQSLLPFLMNSLKGQGQTAPAAPAPSAPASTAQSVNGEAKNESASTT